MNRNPTHDEYMAMLSESAKVEYDLKNSGLKEISSDIFNEHPHLKMLNLSHNAIIHIENMTEGRSLEKLYIENNQLRVLEGLETQLNLRILNASNNTISIVNNIEKLRNLRILNLANNSLKTIPNMHYNTFLEQLDVSGNMLKDLPNLKRNAKLRVLKMNDNFIESIADFRERMPLSLRTLHMANNNLKKLTDVKLFYKTIQDMDLTNNPTVCTLEGNRVNVTAFMLYVIPNLKRFNLKPIVSTDRDQLGVLSQTKELSMLLKEGYDQSVINYLIRMMPHNRQPYFESPTRKYEEKDLRASFNSVGESPTSHLGRSLGATSPSATKRQFSIETSGYERASSRNGYLHYSSPTSYNRTPTSPATPNFQAYFAEQQQPPSSKRRHSKRRSGKPQNYSQYPDFENDEDPFRQKPKIGRQLPRTPPTSSQQTFDQHSPETPPPRHRNYEDEEEEYEEDMDVSPPEASPPMHHHQQRRHDPRLEHSSYRPKNDGGVPPIEYLRQSWPRQASPIPSQTSSPPHHHQQQPTPPPPQQQQHSAGPTSPSHKAFMHLRNQVKEMRLFYKLLLKNEHQKRKTKKKEDAEKSTIHLKYAAATPEEHEAAKRIQRVFRDVHYAKHPLMDEVKSLRAQVGGLTRELTALRGQVRQEQQEREFLALSIKNIYEMIRSGSLPSSSSIDEMPPPVPLEPQEELPVISDDESPIIHAPLDEPIQDQLPIINQTPAAAAVDEEEEKEEEEVKGEEEEKVNDENEEEEEIVKLEEDIVDNELKNDNLETEDNSSLAMNDSTLEEELGE